ncbi:MAG: hypothetical protein JST11_29500 [Acidobacteria bacterium]|nr:hypothetical protein [Acidobacteriota bacterium]
MLPGNLLDDLSPHARVATAVLPFVVAMLVRLLFGRTRTAGWLITISTVWFAVNVLVAPYSEGMRSDIRNLGRYLP